MNIMTQLSLALTHFIRQSDIYPRDWPEAVSDVLLFPERFTTGQAYEVNSQGLQPMEKSPHPAIAFIFWLFARTIGLPFTLIGLACLRFSQSHAQLQKLAHWDLIQQQRAQPSYSETDCIEQIFTHDYLYNQLLDNLNSLSHPETHIPAILHRLREHRNSEQFIEIIQRLSSERVGLYAYYCMKSGALDLRDFIIEQVESSPEKTNSVMENIQQAVREDMNALGQKWQVSLWKTSLLIAR
jgi:hypothetical protein